MICAACENPERPVIGIMTETNEAVCSACAQMVSLFRERVDPLEDPFNRKVVVFVNLTDKLGFIIDRVLMPGQSMTITPPHLTFRQALDRLGEDLFFARAAEALKNGGCRQ